MFLYFLRRNRLGPVVTHRSDSDEDIYIVRLRMHSLQHLLRAAHVHGCHALRICKRRGPGHQHHARARLKRGLSYSIAHFPRAAICDAAHWIEGLPGRTGGDEHMPAIKGASRKQLCGPRRYLGRLEHTPRSGFATGLRSLRRPEHPYSVLLDPREVVLGGRVFPHLLVHRRRQRNHGLCGETQRAEEIIGAPVRHLGDEIGTGRRDDYGIGPARELDVAHARFRLGIEHVQAHGVGADRLHGQRCDELCRRPRHDNLDLGSQLAEAPCEIGAFVSGNAPRNAER